MSKTNFEVHMKHLKVLVKWNWWWNFTCFCTISLNFEMYIFEFPWKIVFDVISGNCSYLKLLKDCNVLNVILLQGFRPLKTENAQFPIRFHLKSWSVLLMFTYLAGQYWRKHPMIFNEYTRTASAFMSRNRNKTLQRRNQLAVHITMTTIL